jgi:hypothetical protein
MKIQVPANTSLIGSPIYGGDFGTPRSTQDLIPANMVPFFRSEKTTFGGTQSTTPTNATAWLFTADSAGVLQGFHAAVKTPGSAASVTVDLKKNGSTVLSAVITLTNGSTSEQIYSASFSSVTYNIGDYFEAVLTVSSSTGMAGVHAWVNSIEYAQPI